MTNRGELVLELEAKIQDSMQLKNCLIMNNGTIPIQIALKLLGKGGEIITTPFSYIATTSSIVWESCKPVFVDIDPVYWTIDPLKIEAAIVNAKATLKVQDELGTLSSLIWSFAPTKPKKAPRTLSDVPATSPESVALSKELLKRGFKFVGPTTMYAAMQSLGLVNDHLATCFARDTTK